uniref:Uncharacterized protein n=1 Tax=Rhizophora mucronata TaxID=61149 RepID=A0A2P2R1N9_RHIMU
MRPKKKKKKCGNYVEVTVKVEREIRRIILLSCINPDTRRPIYAIGS